MNVYNAYPDFLEPYRTLGQTLKVSGLQFSGPTYQVEVLDPHFTDPLWVFLQFDEREKIKDLFCSCEESTEKGACSHMAAACLYVLEKHRKPLHLLFEKSPFNSLFLQLQEKLGTRPPKIEEGQNELKILTEEGDLLFSVTGNIEFFKKFTKAKPEETEENSIKFSNLSEDELELYRTGRPTLHLRYELSFFSDIAKWLFTHQEECKVSKDAISVRDFVIHTRVPVEAPTDIAELVELFERGELPDDIDISLLKDHLNIPFDETPHTLSYSISFDKKANLHIEALEFPGGKLYGDWILYNKRLIKLAPRKFEKLKNLINKKDLPAFLLANRLWLGEHPGFLVHVAKLEEQILYEVDARGNLIFRSVLQKLPSTKKCIELGDWLYVEGDGFYVKNFTEDNPPILLGREIPHHLVAEYIRHHNDLLVNVPGFFSEELPIESVGLKIWLKKTHIVEIIPEYTWKDPKDAKRSFFYDEFVYIPEKGFYRMPQGMRPMTLSREVSAEDRDAWAHFFQEELPKLRTDYSCRVDPRLERAEELLLTVAPLKSQGNLHSLQVSWEGSKGSVSVKDLIAAKKKNERFFPTDAGWVDLSDDRFRWLDNVKNSKNVQDFTPQDLLRISAYDTIHVDEKGQGGFKQLLERLLTQKTPEEIQFATLDCTLRPYQKNGVDWLWYLYQNGLSGLLCDDMGVGKTHQAMALMDGVRTFMKKEGKKSLFLVVCPTSLIYHWEDKLKRFLPDFRIKSYVGMQRSLAQFPEEYDLLLVSYGIFRNETKEICKYHYDAAFFDELQIAKNHVSQIHTALLQIDASLKVGLTGTPIENHLRELKALFDLVLPGYMPHDQEYREFFMRPIERGDTPKRKELLSRFVRPFILRRRKKDVLPDLPEKTEELSYTELAPEQRNLYRSVASRDILPLIRQLKEEDAPIPYMHIFAVLSALKQICNHPAAYLKDVSNFESYESGKWDTFIELIEEAMESEQKVVVFSQFLAMLDIIELFLKKNGIGYAQIRGQTKNRGDEVARFHNDPNCKIFLGSLQAAGLGIDLTPASIVIHYDRWWNAARENQATDRVHRIGQQKGVQVFKLITKGSIEERIDELITKKATLLEDVVFFDDHQMVKKLSRQEIISLLEGISEE